VAVGASAACAVAIFVFDIKISKTLEQLPLLSSIIDTDIIETFETLNETDEYYQQVKQQMPDLMKNAKTVRAQKISPNDRNLMIEANNGKTFFLRVTKDTNNRYNVTAGNGDVKITDMKAGSSAIIEYNNQAQK
jgi:hypothetical protein